MRFDDEVDHAVLMPEATTYYANIVMPLWMSVARAFKALEDVDIEIIAPSHGARARMLLKWYKMVFIPAASLRLFYWNC